MKNTLTLILWLLCLGAVAAPVMPSATTTTVIVTNGTYYLATPYFFQSNLVPGLGLTVAYDALGRPTLSVPSLAYFTNVASARLTSVQTNGASPAIVGAGLTNLLFTTGLTGYLDGASAVLGVNLAPGSSTNALYQTNGVDLGTAGTLSFGPGLTGYVAGAVAYIGASSSSGSGDAGGTNSRQGGSLNLTNWSLIPTGAMANVVAATALTNYAAGASNTAFTVGAAGTNNVIAATNSASVTNWITTRQPSDPVLSNLVGTAARNVTNVVSLSTSNATSKPLTNAYAAGVLTMFGLEQGANITLTPNGSNIVIAGSAGGGLATNNNQFAANPVLTFKKGGLLTNATFYSDAAGLNTALSLYNEPGSEQSLLQSRDEDSDTSIDLNHLHILTLRGSADSALSPIAIFDNIGAGTNAATLWRVGAVESVLLRGDVLGNTTLGPAVGATGRLEFNTDGGSGVVRFNQQGVGTQWVIEPAGGVSYLRGAGDYVNIVTNISRIYVTSNSYIMGTNLVAALIVTNDLRILGHNVASNAFWVCTNATTGEGEWRGNLALVQPASIYLSNLVTAANGTGMLTNNGSGVLGWMAIPSGGEANVNGEVSLTNATMFGLVNGKTGLTNLLRSIAARYGLLGTNEGGTNISIAIDPAIMASQANLTSASNALISRYDGFSVSASNLSYSIGIDATNYAAGTANNVSNWVNSVSNRLDLFSTALTNNTATASNNLRTIMVNALTNKVDNIAGEATNLTVHGLTVDTNLSLLHVTASRPAYINGSGQLTNAAGTPDGSKFLRDDGVLATPEAAATAGGFSGAIQFAEGTAIAGTNRFDWDRTNEVLNMNGLIASTVSAPPSNSLAFFTANTNNYVQYNIRNLSAGNGAESGYAATADNGTEKSVFAWMGINSSAFSATRAYSIGGANDSVWIGSGNDMRVANANTNKDIIFSGGTAGTPFWQQRAIIKSTTSGGALGVTAGLSSSNAWVGGKILEVRGLTFTNHSALFSLTNAYTNATLIAANTLTNQGASLIFEWTIAHRKQAVATNVYQVVFGSEIIFNSGLNTYSNGMSVIRSRITRGASATSQDCETLITPFLALATTIGQTNLWTSSQSNWVNTPIGLRMSSSGAQLITNVSFRAYYEPETR